MEGYNLGPLAIKLHEKSYDYRSGIIDGRMDEIEKQTGHLSLFTDLLTVINVAKQTDKTHIDLSDRRELVDEARKICPDLFPEGVYTWDSEDSIMLLTDGINQQSKKIATVINPLMMLNNQNLQDITELTKIFTEIIKIEREEKQHSVSKQIATR